MSLDLTLIYAVQFSLVIVTLCTFFVCAFAWGRQTVINIIISLLIGLLLYHYFPFQSWMMVDNIWSNLSIKITIFIVLVIVNFILIRNLMLPAYDEGRLESFNKKILLAVAGTLVVVPITLNEFNLDNILFELSPLLISISSESLFFFWLILVGIIVWFAS